MTHPLTDKFLTQFGMPTDEFLIQFGIPDDQCVEGERVFFEEDIRAAADWQLRQVKLTGQCVINELHENNCHIEADHAAAFLEVLAELCKRIKGVNE